MSISRFVFTIAAILALGAAWTPEALALDGYWHGMRSKLWGDGVSGSTSNWYTAAPPSGTAQDVPNDTAMFAPGALEMSVDVQGKQSIQTVIFTAGSDPYDINIKPSSSLAVNGLGITNGSSVAQYIYIDGDRANLEFNNNSVACINPGTILIITNTNGGTTTFRDKAKGNTGCQLRNRKAGTIKFLNTSSADDMYLRNDGKNSKILFSNKSTGGNVIINNFQGKVIYRSYGPNGNGRLTGKEIYSTDILDVSNSKITLSKQLILKGKSKFYTSFNGRKGPGYIHSANEARLSGTLTINGSKKAKPGKYTIIKSDKRRDRKFSKVLFKGFKSSMKAKIVYTKKTVDLVLSKK